ncbi:hypothetical protein I4U23_016212 [Adineta vaga]|nr:hypothetical protein I4U23_016212 [Adineta vaga]
MMNMLQRLESFEGRVCAALYRDPRKEDILWPLDEDTIGLDNTYDKLAFVQVFKAVQWLTNYSQSEFQDEWTHSFLRRVDRTICGMPDEIKRSTEPEIDDDMIRNYLIDPWEHFYDECRNIPLEWEYAPDSNDPICLKHQRVKQYEDELDRRNKQFEAIHGPRKTLRELCKQYHVLLAEYLAKCISFHSTVPVQNFDVDSENEERKVTKEKHASVRTIDIPLHLSASTLVVSNLSSLAEVEQNISAPFIPSQKETYISSKSNLSCEDFLKTFRWAIVLGDPGCGKTTLLRWILLQFTRSLSQQEDVFNSNSQKPDQPESSIFCNKYLLRLPILIRIGELITWLEVHPSSKIIDYVKEHTWFKSYYIKQEVEDRKFLCDFIYHGHSLLLFDGLDEVANYSERKNIVRVIETFIEEYIYTPEHISPKFVGGNQVIITSRITGYYLYPIKGKLSSLFTLESMNEDEVQAFVKHWLIHAQYSSHHNTTLDSMNIESIRLEERKMETWITETVFCLDRKNWSHPMLLSLILPLLCKPTATSIQLTSPLQLYEATVRFVFDAWSHKGQTIVDSEVAYWLLYDMAIYIHTHCPSGLIDAFDMNHLFCISLKNYYDIKKTPQVRTTLIGQVEAFVSALTTNLVGFVSARGLDAYGFSHRSFQEYFVAQGFMKSPIDDINLVLDRLLMHILKPNFQQPLKLTVEWLKLAWKPKDYDAFCLQLSQRFIGKIPIGALFILSALKDLSVHSVQLLISLFNALVSPFFNEYLIKYFISGMIEMQMICYFTENLLCQEINGEILRQIFVNSLEKNENDKILWKSWMSETHLLKLESCHGVNVDVQTTVDWILRHRSDESHEYTILQMANRFADNLIVKNTNMCPAVLSLLIILCGGLHHADQDIASLLCNDPYKPTLIQFNCHAIIIASSTNDVSKQVVDAFITLICLRGLDKLCFYEELSHYRALPVALYRMRLTLYYLRQLYLKEKNNNSGDISPTPDRKYTKLEGYKILEKIITDEKVHVSDANSFLIAYNAAYTHLFSHTLLSQNLSDQSISLSTSTKEKLIADPSCCSAQVLHLILYPYSKDTKDDSIKWHHGKHPFQIYCHYPLFPVAFISSKFRLLFERLVTSAQVSHSKKLILAVLLAEVILSVEESFSKSPNEISIQLLLLLQILHSDIQQCRLESCSQAIMYSAQMLNNCNDWHFSEKYRDLTTDQAKEALELAIDRERERLRSSSDLELFAASIGLTRLLILSENRNKELLQDIKTTALIIKDPLLQILCLRHIRQIVRRYTDTQYYYSIQEALIVVLENLSIDGMSLLTLTFILSTCIEENLHPSLDRLLKDIWRRLKDEPNCEDEKLDQAAIFQIIQHVIGHHQTLIPHPNFHRLTFLKLNSSIFHQIFQDRTFTPIETVLLAQLYIVEVTIDAQILVQFTPEMIPTPMKFASFYVKQMLQESWKINYRKLTHQEVILLNHLVISSSSSSELENIPLKKFIKCTGFQDQNDRPIVESWLKYYDDDQRASIAILAVILLIEDEHDMIPTIRLIVETIIAEGLSSKNDLIRQGIRLCFIPTDLFIGAMNDYRWCSSIWQCIRTLMIKSLGGTCTLYSMSTIQQMNSLLETERERLRICDKKDLYSNFSILSLINETFNNDGSDIHAYISRLLVTEDQIEDKYIAFVLFHIVRQCKQKTWCDSLFDLLHALLYNANLPNVQIAVVYTLASQERGKKILFNTLNAHFQNGNSSISDKEKRLSESQLIAYMVALTNSKDEFNNERSLFNDLDDFTQFIEMSPVYVQRHFQACLYSHMDDDHDEALPELKSMFELTLQDIYTVFILNTSYFVIEWQERSYWFAKAAYFITLHRNELLGQFVTDLHSYLITQTRSHEFQNPIPNYLAVTNKLVNENSKEFCQAVRLSKFGEEEFKNALRLFNERGLTMEQRNVCLRIYVSFGKLTVDFVDMMFAICLDDFSPLQCNINYYFDSIHIADREGIEKLSDYLKSSSMRQRRLAMIWLIRLVQLDIMSILEVQQLLSGKVIPNVKSENDDLDTFCRRYRFPYMETFVFLDSPSVLTSEEVEVDFFEVLTTLC